MFAWHLSLVKNGRGGIVIDHCCRCKGSLQGKDFISAISCSKQQSMNCAHKTEILKFLYRTSKARFSGLPQMVFYISGAKCLDYKTLHKLFCGLSSTARTQALHVKK
jgi:hypothetical protein